MLQQNDDKHEEAHRRLRADHRELEQKYDALARRIGDMELAMSRFRSDKEAPIDVGQIVFAPKMVMAIIALVTAILGGTWFINQPIVSRLDRFEERQASTKDVIDGLNKAMEMRRLEIQGLSNQFQQFQLQQQQQRGH